MPEIPEAYVNTIWKFVLSLFVLIATLGTNRAIRILLRKHVSEASHRSTLQMLIRNGTLIQGAIIVLAIWLGFGSSFTVAMGILGAGIAFTSQEVIGSLAGYLNIVTEIYFGLATGCELAMWSGTFSTSIYSGQW